MSRVPIKVHAPRSSPIHAPRGPGASGGATGRPAGLALRIRELTNDLEEQVRVMIELSAGQHGAGPRERYAACDWLVTRVYGKPVESVVQLELNARQAAEIGITLTDDHLERLARRLDASTEEERRALAEVLAEQPAERAGNPAPLHGNPPHSEEVE